MCCSVLGVALVLHIISACEQHAGLKKPTKVSYNVSKQQANFDILKFLQGNKARRIRKKRSQRVLTINK